MTPDNANEQSDASGIIEIVSNTVTADTSGVIEIEHYDVSDVTAQTTPVTQQHDALGVIEIEQYELPEADVALGVVEVVQYDVPESEMNVQNQPSTADATLSVTGSLNKGTVASGVVASNSPAAINIAVKPVSETKNEASVMAEKTSNNKVTSDGKFEDWVIKPESAWPPPIFMKKNVSAKERFYLEYRWHSQWSYYDNKAGESKNKYYASQYVVVIGSLIIPALVSVASTIARFFAELLNNGNAESEAIWRIGIDAITIVISLFVAGAAALETLYKHGENWSSYRSAAEELQAEKNFYDMSAGPYANNANPFATFVERVEGIVANQNGKYFQAVQQQIAKQAEENEEIVASFKAGDDDDDEYQLSVSRQPVETPVVDAVVDTVSDVVDTATEIVSDPEPEI